MKYFILILSILILCFCSRAQDVYSYGDTLKTSINLSSGYYGKIDYGYWYVYRTPDDAVAGSYTSNGSFTLKTGSGPPDSLMTASWAIPSDQNTGNYYLTTVMSYDGTVLKPQTKSFKIGPLSVVDADTLGGYGYIDQTSSYSGGTIGAILLQSGAPAYGGEIIALYSGTHTFAGSADIDASGNFRIWVPSTGTYDIQARYSGYVFGKKRNITPTVP